MNTTFRVLRYFLAALILAVSLTLLGGWWVVHQSLPTLDGEAALPELKQQVTVDRDQWGVPRIQAGSLEDLVTAQGYVLAQDRLWQMDVLRRAAAGELAEIFGTVAVEPDRENRVLGFRVAAEKCVAEMDAATRGILEAYARGVNRYIIERQDRLPMEFRILGYQPRPWSPADSLLVGAYMYKELTSSWEAELNRAKIVVRLGAELAGEMYATTDSPYDHFLVGAEKDASKALPAEKRAAANRFKKFFGAKARNNRGEGASLSPELNPRPGTLPGTEPILWREATDVLEGFQRETELALGSNNWVVNGAHTYSGKPMLANDTHLPLGVPCIWYIVHLVAPEWNVKGFALPGVPLVIIGHNDRIAWGFTNLGADVQDLYTETFNPDNPREYKVNGKWVEAEIRKELIRVRNEKPVELEVVVTRHGPVVRREGQRGYALRWTATEPGGLNFGFPWLGKARNWDEFRAALRRVTGPAQNTVYADVDGNIGYAVAAEIPIRKKGRGEMPVPGDTDDYEWTGYIPYEELPMVFNPPSGSIATANARVVGPGYKWHLTDDWMSPYRTERIYQLLGGHSKLRPADCLQMQTDLVSIPHRLLADYLKEAYATQKPQDSRTEELVRQLDRWNGRATQDSLAMAFLEFTRRGLRRRILEEKLGKETGVYRWWRAEVFIQQVLQERPAQWLPKPFSGAGSASEGYDRFLIQSADDAVREMEQESGRKRIVDWEWGRFMQLKMFHPLGQTGLPRRHLSLGPIPQAGSAFTVKQTGVVIGPAMRFVADLANFDNSLMNLTTGQSGQYLSRYYKNQFPQWYEGRGIASVFSEAAWKNAREHRLTLRPSTATAR